MSVDERFLYGKQADAVTVCQNLYDTALAAPLAQPLIPFGVTTPKLAELKESMDNFADAIPRPETTIKNKKSVTQQIAEEFATADLLLAEGLDRLIPQFKKTAPEFVKDYLNARVPVAKAATLDRKKPAKAVKAAKATKVTKAKNPPQDGTPSKVA